MYLVLGSLLVSTIWGLTPFYSKHITELGHSAETILFISSVAFFILMSLIMLFYHTPTSLWKEVTTFYNKINILHFLLWIFLLYILSIIIYYSLLSKHHTFLVIALTSLYPLVTLLASFYLAKIKPKPIHFIAILFITVGVVLVQLDWPYHLLTVIVF